MPNYDYQCSKCQHVQEEFHSMKETPVIVCAKCKSKKMAKLFALPQINMGEFPGSHPDEVN